MSPASYRTAPPRVGEIRLRDRSRLLQSGGRHLGHVKHHGNRKPLRWRTERVENAARGGTMAGDVAGGAYGSVLLGPAEQSPRQLRVRIQTLLTVLLVATYLIGAGIVFVLSTLVIPSPPLDQGSVLALAIGVPVYVGVAIFVGTVWGTAGALRALRWAIEDRDP